MPPNTPNTQQPIYSAQPQPQLPQDANIPNQEAPKAVVPIVLGIISLIAWLLPIIGFPVAIIGMVLGIRSLRKKEKYSKLALALIGLGLAATIANSATGAWKGYHGTLFKSNSSQESTTNTSATNSTSSSDSVNFTAYPEASKTAFINGCVNSGGTESKCGCVFAYIESKINYEQFAKYDQEIRKTGKASPAYQQLQDEAIGNCRNW